MGFKLSMLTAVALGCIPIAAGAQASYPSGGSSQSSDVQAQEGMTKAEAASKKASDAKADAKASGSATAATEADVKAGVSVFDSKGGSVGKVESVDAKGAVIDTGKVKARVPISSLARNDKGLVISMTASEIEAAANAKAK